jgi:hypothetical protein
MRNSPVLEETDECCMDLLMQVPYHSGVVAHSSVNIFYSVVNIFGQLTYYPVRFAQLLERERGSDACETRILSCTVHVATYAFEVPNIAGHELRIYNNPVFICNNQTYKFKFCLL